MGPWNLSLPVSLSIGGEEEPIRTDYRVALDIFLALTDPELDEFNRSMEVLDILYVNEISPANWQEALDQAMWYLRGGEPEHGKKGPKLVSWEQDFNLIAAPISANLGKDVRSMEMHWWTFLQCYQAIGDCFFAQIVRIRDKLARRKPLDKQDREFYKKNREYIDIKTELTVNEKQILKEWM